MTDGDLDNSISLALQQVGCLSVTIKAEQRACIKSVYDGKDVFYGCLPASVNPCVTRCCRSFLATSSTGKTGDRFLHFGFSRDRVADADQ